MIVEDATGQQLWQVDAAGKVRRKNTRYSIAISVTPIEEAICTRYTSLKMELKNLDLPSLITRDVLVAYRRNSKRQIQSPKAADNSAE